MTIDWKLPWDGGCRCEQVRIRISEPPVVTMACHCQGCQRMTASAYSLSVLLPAPGLAVTRGGPVIGGIHGPDQHFHCPHCKSWMFTRPHQLTQFVNVRATMLDVRDWFSPFVETSRAEGYAWAQTGAAYTFPNIPGPEAFGPIVADFAARGPHPH